MVAGRNTTVSDDLIYKFRNFTVETGVLEENIVMMTLVGTCIFLNSYIDVYNFAECFIHFLFIFI